MTEVAKEESPLLVSTGEFRTGVMELLDSLTVPIQVLMSPPGLVHGRLIPDQVVAEPWAPLPAKRASECWQSLLDHFRQEVDQLPQTEEWEDRLLEWIEALRIGHAQVRYWHRAPLFTRLLSRADRTLTFAGPVHDRLDDTEHELRVELVGAEHTKARRWFEERFAEGQDSTTDILECLQNSWAGGLISPKDAYYKTLAECFSGVVAGLDRDAEDNPMLENLTEFQLEAYQYAKNVLARYGGVFLADVVGLGKTFIALALLAHLQRRYAEHAVVVAPPNVIPAWQALASEFRVELALVSSGKLEDLDHHTDREVLVIDESHNFRNAGTLRYERIQRWLRPDGSASQRKVLLLSATPQNNDAKDVKHQLELFPDTFMRLPFRGESLADWFDQVRAGGARLTDMLQHVVIRRTRKYIKSAYPAARLRHRVAPGKYEEVPLHFPKRVSGDDQCLRYSITETYHGDLYDRIINALANLRYPLHGLGAYVKPEHVDDARVRGIRKAGTSVRGLFKVLLLKRFESSVYAFRVTLNKLVRRLELAKQGLASRTVQVRRRPGSSGDAEDVDFEEEVTVPTDLFDVERLGKDIMFDLASARSLIGLVQDLGPLEDAKLTRLREYIQVRPPGQHKLLVFTQFADTAQYLHRALSEEHNDVGLATGGGGGALEAARRFAPRASRFDIGKKPEIDLLVATDVLSEGINLQDADTLVNYDLHWNPVRLIQRAGRIDRIGSEHDEIHIASFLPERQLEAGLGLQQVLQKRIDEFIKVFGEDSRILPGSDRPDVDQMTQAYAGKALADDSDGDELDGLSRHVDRLLRLRRTDPEYYSQILKMRSGRRATSEASGPGIIVTRLAWLWTFWRLDSEGLNEMETLEAMDTLHRLAQADRRDVPLREGRTQLAAMNAARERFVPIADTFRAQRQHPRLNPTMQYVLSQLEDYQKGAPESRKDLIRALVGWVRQGHALVILTRHAKRWRKEEWSPEAVFNECRYAYAQAPLKSEELGEAHVVVGSFGADAHQDA